MSFYQNSLNQWATQEQLEPQANSRRVLRWDELFTNDGSEDHAASFGVQHESNGNNILASSNGGNLYFPEPEFFGSYSQLKLNLVCGKKRLHSARDYFHALYSSMVGKQFSKSDLIELLDSLINGIERDATWGFKCNSSVMDTMEKLNAINEVLKYLAAEFPKHDYCHVLKMKLMTFKFNFGITMRKDRKNIPSGKKLHGTLNAFFAAINKNIEKLKTWDSRQCFLCGQSKKFTNVVCAKDLLPQNDGPTTCGVCLSTIEETSDFAVQSDCAHIFCTPCITTWFETKKDCPMCRQRGVFMSKNRFFELRSRGSEPAH